MSASAMPIRPRRSVLYMPGSNARALEKAKSLPVDGVILDLEDAVAPEAKTDAREAVCAAVKAGGYGKREVVIRINALETEWGEDDLAAAAEARPDAILVPKVECDETIYILNQKLSGLGAAPQMGLWVMIETPRAVIDAGAIAAAAKTTRLSCFVMGTNDIAKELRCAQTDDRLPLLASLSMGVLAARSAGLAVIDGVFNRIGDEDGFIRSCRQGVEFGFDGKTLIHPSQVAPCNRLFSPDPDEVAWARRIIAAFEEPDNRSKGAIKVDGRMVERLHADEGRRLVAVAEAIAEMEG